MTARQYSGVQVAVKAEGASKAVIYRENMRKSEDIGTPLSIVN